MKVSKFFCGIIVVLLSTGVPLCAQETTPVFDIDLDNDGLISSKDIFVFVSYWHEIIDSATPTGTPTATPTEEFPTESPTPSPTEMGAGLSFSIPDYFVLTPGSTWTFGTPGKGTVGEGFTWLVLDDLVDLGGGLQATSIRTTAFSTDHVRHLDEDFWSIDETTGHLLFHGIREAFGFELKGLGLTIPPQDFVLDPPVDFGGTGLDIGEVIETTAEVRVTADIPPFGEQEIEATALATVTYLERIPTFSTEMGEFTDVVKLSVNIQAVVNLGLTEIDVEFLNNEFFLKEGVGLVAIDLDPDLGNMNLLTLSDGTLFIDGSPVDIIPE